MRTGEGLRPKTITAALALLLAVSAGVASSQETPPSSAPPPAASEKTVAETASPELVGQLVNELGVTPNQAQAAAGTLFGVAKGKLKPEDFSKVASAVPNMAGLLAAAPAPASDPLSGMVGSLGGVAAAAGTLSKIGLKPDTIARLTPTLVKAVQSKGGAEVGALLAGALK